MRVVATQIGYYGGKVVEFGEAFVLASSDDFSKAWMEKASDAAPEPVKKRRGYEPPTTVASVVDPVAADPITGIMAVSE